MDYSGHPRMDEHMFDDQLEAKKGSWKSVLAARNDDDDDDDDDEVVQLSCSTGSLCKIFNII